MNGAVAVGRLCSGRGSGLVRSALAVVMMLGPAAVFSAAPALAQDAPAATETGETKAAPKAEAADKNEQLFPILVAREIRDEPLPLSLLDLPPDDLGIAGAKLAIKDNNTTGQFMNQRFELDVVENSDPEKLIKDVVARVDAGTPYIIADLAPDTLLKLSDALAGKEALIINYSAPDDRLREQDCRPNVMHTPPTRSMLADALAQYLIWKKWNRWFLVLGPQEKDKLFADALRRAAKRFGAKIVEERKYEYKGGSRRADGGFEQVQQQMPTFTQDAPDYDVMIVADEGNLFGDYLPYRTWDPRPVAGTSGLVPTSWHPAVELWGGTQFQNRFKRLADRNMRPTDYNAWMAVRMIGEAAPRVNSNNFNDIVAFIRSPKFELAAFKGLGLSLRDWNGQLRQPVILTTPKILVSVSPQPGFLHQFSELDTLGVDKPETKCRAFTQ